MFHKIPIELWIISEHLDESDYHNLRLSSVNINLALVPTVSFAKYKKANPEMVKLCPNEIHKESLCYMSEYGHYNQLKECLSKKSISCRWLQCCLLECTMALKFDPSIALLLLDKFDLEDRFQFMDFDLLFCKAIDSLDVKLIKKMLDFQRTDPCCNENYPISTASKFSNREILEDGTRVENDYQDVPVTLLSM
ncbi:hypothetical protein HDV06_005587 [Boothiomyces sp. JEL0866]|nr:hypothetical protein HDV06_005587 [Boothiomyces sp. JEL0866]